MAIFYNAKTGGFYMDSIHGDKIPDKSVEITAAAYTALLQGQRDGKVIGADKRGTPVLAEPPAPPESPA